jgi:hypothetical protein
MKKVFLAAALGATIMMSCSHDHEVLDQNSDEAVVARFNSSINGATMLRAGNNTWSAGNTIGIFMVNNTPEAVDATENRAYRTTDGSSHFSHVATTDIIYYPVDNSTVNFISYYPYQSGITLENEYDVDVSDQSNPVDIDLLYAKTTAGYSKTTSAATPVKLMFDHKLTQLVMNITAGEGLTNDDLKGMSVTIKGLNTQTTFDLTDGTLGSASTKVNIVTKVITDGAQYSAILVPQSVTASTVTVDFNVGNETFVWKVPACEFETQKKHIYTVTIARTGVDVEGEINDWTEGTGGSGTAD